MNGFKSKLIRRVVYRDQPDRKAAMRERRLMGLPNGKGWYTIRDNGLRREYQRMKNSYKRYGPMPWRKMI